MKTHLLNWMSLENQEKVIFVLLALTLVASFVVAYSMVKSAWEEYKALKAWRTTLTRGMMVRVRGEAEKQQVHVVRNGMVTLRYHVPNGFFYKAVPLTDIYPYEQKVEWELTES